MKIRTSLIALSIATLVSGCQNLDTNTLMAVWRTGVSSGNAKQ
ncbi:Uncharacterised protein [Serratia odorifera]|uniref:Uncharacterized protein n=1 Tax=Serratia odorifera TaxID=618 RepID=A0A3S4HP88_SEROD|nr:Uncharacterised protein [Serratia odorifera]